MEEQHDEAPGMGVPLAHVLVYWIPLSLLLWAVILVPLYFLAAG